MAVLYQAQGAIAASTGADVTPVWPTHAADDIGIAHVFYRSQTPTVLTPSGWTLLEGPYDGNASTRHYWFWKRAAGSSETNPLMDKSAATGDTYARIYTIRGAWTGGDPFEDVVPTAHTTADSFAIAGVTSLTANALIFGMVGEADDAANDFTAAGTDPAAFSQDAEVSTTGNDGLMGRFNASRATAGATGDIAIQWQNAPDGGAFLVVAIGDSSSAINVTITSVAATATAVANVPPEVGGPEDATVTSVAATASALATTAVPTVTMTLVAATATASATSPTLTSFVDGSIFDIPGPPPTVVYKDTAKGVYAQFRDPDGAFYDPDTVTFKTRAPNGATVSYVWETASEVTNPATGVYLLIFTVDQVGPWTVAARGEDEDAVGQVAFPVRASAFD